MSVSEDAGAVLFTVLCLTSVHCTKNTLIISIQDARTTLVPASYCESGFNSKEKWHYNGVSHHLSYCCTAHATHFVFLLSFLKKKGLIDLF